MVFDFPVVGLAQADHMNFVMPWCEDHGMESSIDESKRIGRRLQADRLWVNTQTSPTL
jgi:hypothetical protein